MFYADNFFAETKSVNYPTYNRIWIITGLVLFVLSVAGLMALEKAGSNTKLFSRIWLVSILLTIASAVYLNQKKAIRILK